MVYKTKLISAGVFVLREARGSTPWVHLVAVDDVFEDYAIWYAQLTTIVRGGSIGDFILITFNPHYE